MPCGFGRTCFSKLSEHTLFLIMRLFFAIPDVKSNTLEYMFQLCMFYVHVPPNIFNYNYEELCYFDLTQGADLFSSMQI